MKWKLHFFSSLCTQVEAEGITCCNSSLLAVLLGVVIIKYRILRLSWQFVLLMPSLHWILYLLATRVFHKNSIFTSSAHRKSLFIDFLYSLGKMVFFVYNYFMPLPRILSGWSIWPHSTDFKAFCGHVPYFFQWNTGKRSVLWCWRNIRCFRSLSCAPILHPEKSSILGRCVSLARFLKWEALGHKSELNL